MIPACTTSTTFCILLYYGTIVFDLVCVLYRNEWVNAIGKKFNL